MKLLASFLVMISLVLSLPNSSGNEAQEEYCNQRFNYCLQYPAETFTAKAIASNGDGMILVNEDNTIKIKVAGAHNIMDWSIEELNQFYFDELSRTKPMEVELVEIYTEDAYGWVVMKYNYEMQFYKINLLDGAYVTTLITVPGSSPELLEELKEKIGLSFPV